MATKTLKKTKELTKAQMCVIVAKDALKQLEAEKYTACTGIYVDWELEDKINYSKPDAQVQNIIKKHEKPCDVCARGALLLSSIRKFNDVTVSKYQKRWESKSKEIFSEKTLKLAEIAFEQWHKLTASPKELEAEIFGSKYNSETGRLKAILENIVTNNGEFKP